MSSKLFYEFVSALSEEMSEVFGIYLKYWVGVYGEGGELI